MPKKIIFSDDLHAFYLKILPFLGKGSSSEGGGGHKIEDDAGTELTQRDTLQFGDGFSTSDDSTNEKTVVEPTVMSASDMDDVVTPLPSVRSGYHRYSTDEKVVGEWIDGSPVYEKTFIIQPFTHPTVSATHSSVFELMPNNGQKIISAFGYLNKSQGSRGLQIPSASLSGLTTPEVYHAVDVSVDETRIKLVYQRNDDASISFDLTSYVTLQYVKATT